jgi:hypothetical protein
MNWIDAAAAVGGKREGLARKYEEVKVRGRGALEREG